jgi:hypothetical protein
MVRLEARGHHGDLRFAIGLTRMPRALRHLERWHCGCLQGGWESVFGDVGLACLGQRERSCGRWGRCEETLDERSTD